MSLATLTILLLALLALAVGLFLAAVPYLMPPNECFAVTVPPGAQENPAVIALKHRYAATMAVVSVIAAAASAFAALSLIGSAQHADNALAAVLLVTAALLVPAVASFALMVHYRTRVQALKRKNGWAATTRLHAAVIGEEDLPHAPSLAWNLLYLAIIGATLALGLLLYPAMPDMIPIHADLTGAQVTYAPKTPASVFGMTLGTEAVLAAVFTLTHPIIIHAKRPTDPSAPATSSLAYALYLRAQTIFLLAVGVVLTAVLGVAFMLSSAGIFTMSQAGAAILFACVLIVVGCIALSLVYGQNGTRLFARMADGAALPDDDDEHWKLGTFYLNRDDAALFVPKRFGIGWTMNLARPGAWAALAAILLIALAPLGLTAVI